MNSDEAGIRNAFFLERCSDHAEFILSKLAPVEIEFIKIVSELKSKLDKELMETIKNGYVSVQLVENSIAVKQEILFLRSKVNSIKLNMTPTFISHMLNEEKEFLSLLKGAVRTPNDIKLHKLWIVDAEGHADAIFSELDPIDLHRKTLKKQIKALKQLSKKVVELFNYNQHIKLPKEVIITLITEAMALISDFKQFMEELEENEWLGILDPKLLDHMIREELYYLYELGVGGIEGKDFIRYLEK